jgi:hypothetical protein
MLTTLTLHYCTATGAMVKRLRNIRLPRDRDTPSVLEEQTVKFSVAARFYQVCAAILGAANLGGVLYLRYFYNHKLVLLTSLSFVVQ